MPPFLVLGVTVMSYELHWLYLMRLYDPISQCSHASSKVHKNKPRTDIRSGMKREIIMFYIYIGTVFQDKYV